MHDEASVQQASSGNAFQQFSVAAYPQLCGSWPGDGWPEDILLEQRDDLIDRCAAEHIECPGEMWTRWPA